MSDYQIIVLDIGKTNKKLFVYDSEYRCLNPEETGVVIDPVTIDGILCDDMASIHTWMMDALKDAAAKYDAIRAISISAHGATISLLGKERDAVFPGDGGLAFPIVSYEQGLTDAEEQAFFQDIGLTIEEAQRETATANFGWLINHGKQIHWLKATRPEQFAKVTDVLMFAQYLGYLLTGEKGIEPTYIGCHGYLLSADGTQYSAVADKLGVTDKLPWLPFRKTYEPLGTLKPELAQSLGLPEDCLVTMGVHDSNAALVPYFANGFEDFVVQDSGTWIVTMAPVTDPMFADDELGKEVFFNRSIDNKPVKTTIFRGGAEFDFYRTQVLKAMPRPGAMDVELLREIVSKRECFSLPTVERGSGLFPDSVARLVGVETIFSSPEAAWAVVDLGLAVQGAMAIRGAGGDAPTQVFIEGNVGKRNPIYRSVISGLFPASKVSFGSTGGAPYGAAVIGVAAAEGMHPSELPKTPEIHLEEVPKPAIPHDALGAYVDAFLRQVKA